MCLAISVKANLTAKRNQVTSVITMHAAFKGEVLHLFFLLLWSASFIYAAALLLMFFSVIVLDSEQRATTSLRARI